MNKVEIIDERNPGIRVDRILEHIAEYAARKLGGGKAWDAGLGEVVRTAIQENPSIPKEHITAVEAARRIGLLQKQGKGVKRAV
jgi:hypothetical protein